MKAHGLYSVMGNFGGGKTFGTFLDLYGMNKDENYIIANVPYSKVDLFFSTKDQLFKIIDDLEKYCQDTNYNIANYFNDLQNLKNIVLVVDEAHLYFPARGRKDKNNLRDKISIIVSQCRKRRIKIFIISQRLKTVDLNFRRLSDFIIQYKKRSFLGLIHWCHRSLYENAGDVSDIQGDEQKSYVVSQDGKKGPDEALLTKELFRPLTTFFKLFSRRNKAYQEISKEPYNSLFISGLKIKDVFTGLDPENLRKPIPEQKKENVRLFGDSEGRYEELGDIVGTIQEEKQKEKMSKNGEETGSLFIDVSPIITEESSSQTKLSPFIIRNQDKIPIYNSQYQ